ncbi:MAG TPA: GNAT family acetyltransferase [Planctomycetaceae bacterium]|nr:GNAT family acetyltransferase [Planctomycetaceae bacterium]
MLITPEDPRSAAAQVLIAALSAELAVQYDHMDDGSGGFRPADVDGPRSTFLVGRVDDIPVACGALRPLEPSVAEMKRVFVAASYRGRGLSKRLLAALEDAARAMGYAAIRLETGNLQHAAIRLYEATGYRHIDPFGEYVGVARSVCFEKRLSPPMTIRPFAPADEPAVIALWQRCDLTRPWNDPHKDIARKLAVRPDLFLVGTVNEEIVATAMAGYEGHRGWISYLAVDPAHQRRGYGRAIVAAAEALLRASGCPKINLQVRTTNTAVIGFYQSLGFTLDDVVSLGKRLEHDC